MPAEPRTRKSTRYRDIAARLQKEIRLGRTEIGGLLPTETELMARHGASLIICPQAELRLGARAPLVAPGGDGGRDEERLLARRTRHLLARGVVRHLHLFAARGIWTFDDDRHK